MSQGSNSGHGDGYSDLPFTRDELADIMRSYYDDIIDFVTAEPFKRVLEELYSLPDCERPGFVVNVLLNDSEIRKRGISVPPGVLIQRSAFGDRRPTLFCVKKLLPEQYSAAWQNVNITFDNEFADESVSRSPESSWRNPLPIQSQAEAMAKGLNLENVTA